MNKMPMLDMGWGAMVYLFGLFSLVIFIPLTILVETLVIRKYLNVGLWRSLLDALVMNLISGVLGFLLLITVAPRFAGGEYLGATYYDPTQEALFWGFLGMLGPLCIASVLVEGFILSLMERKSPVRSVWLIALISNLVSYSGLFAVGFLYFYLLLI